MIKKKIFFSLLIYLYVFYSSADINTLAIDVNNYQKFGYRPLSLGLDYYLNVQGNIQEVNYKYAFCIYGKGFFAILDCNQQVCCSRDGFFHIDSEGFLVNKDNYRVLGKNSDISQKKFEFIVAKKVIDKNATLRKGIQRIDSNSDIQIDYFLILTPQNIKNFKCDYVYATDYTSINTYIVQYARESFPVSYEQLLDMCIKEFQVEKKAVKEKVEIYKILEYQKGVILNQTILDLTDIERLLKKLDELKTLL